MTHTQIEMLEHLESLAIPVIAILGTMIVAIAFDRWKRHKEAETGEEPSYFHVLLSIFAPIITFFIVRKALDKR